MIPEPKKVFGWVESTEGCVQQAFRKDDLCEEAPVLFCGRLHDIHWLLLNTPQGGGCGVCFVPFPPGDLLHICMCVAIRHHNNHHLWCLVLLHPFNSFLYCSSSAVHINDAEPTAKATACRGVWDIICHNHFTDDGTSSESSPKAPTSCGLRPENNSASVSCHLWFACLTSLCLFFHSYLQVSHSP